MLGANKGVTAPSLKLGETLEMVARRYCGGRGLYGGEILVILVEIHKVPECLVLEALQAYGVRLIDGPEGPEVSDHSDLLAPREELVLV